MVDPQSSPIVDVLGIVDASGVSGGRLTDDPLWSLSLRLSPWRISGGLIQFDELAVTRNVSDEELRRWQEIFSPYSVVRIKARVGESAFGPQAILEDYGGKVSFDEELNHHAAELQKPVTFKDAQFGTFLLDRRVDWFEAEGVQWNGTAVRLNLSDADEALDAIETARALWKDEAAWDRRIRDRIVEELHSLKNDTWLGEDEAELSRDEFLGRIVLDAITVHEDGSFTFWYDDGDLFWGHAIEVYGNLTDGPKSANLAG
jgi:hypothetical protein